MTSIENVYKVMKQKVGLIVMRVKQYMVLTSGNFNRVPRKLIIGERQSDEVKEFKYVGNTLNK